MLVTTLVVLLSAAPRPIDRIGATALPDPLGRGAWFVDSTADEVLLATAPAGLQRFACRWAAQVLVDSAGVAYAACRGEGLVRRLTAPAAEWAVGPEPRALALDEATGSLYVALATANEVVVLHPATGLELRRLNVPFEPTALALNRGSLLIGSRRSDRVITFPRQADAPRTEARLGNGDAKVSVGVEHFIAAGDETVAVTAWASLGDLEQPTYYAGFQGPPIGQALFVTRGSGVLWRGLALDVGLADVSSAQWLAGSKTLLLASRGANASATFTIDQKPKRVASWRSAGSGLLAAIDDGELSYTFDDGARSIAVTLSTRFRQRGPLIAIDVSSSGVDAELDRGRQLFHAAGDKRISEKQLACASCHVDGRDDGRTWVGQGSMRQTPMLAGRDLQHTGPYGWDGKYPTLEKYIAFTIQSRLRGQGLPDADLAALARYVRSGLPAVQRPGAENASAVARGKALFHTDAVGCGSCHPSDGAFTDGAVHDVASVGTAEQSAQGRSGGIGGLAGLLGNGSTFGSSGLGLRGIGGIGAGVGALPAASPKKADRRLDTPSLLQAALTAPYLHDGSARTLDEVFARLGDHMGSVTGLSPKERSDLVSYLDTL